MAVLAGVGGGHHRQLRGGQPQVVRGPRLHERRERERLDRRPQGHLDRRVTDGTLDLARDVDLDHVPPVTALDELPAADLREDGRGHRAWIARTGR